MIRIIKSTTYEDGKQHLEAYCLSTDDKPTDSVATGSIIRTVDTGKTYAFNETSSTWTEVNFNGGGGGGGGSSDYTTAEVTVSTELARWTLNVNLSVIDNDNLYSLIDITDSNYSDPIQVLLYKNQQIGALYTEDGILSVSGNATMSGDSITITGDCTITIS